MTGSFPSDGVESDIVRVASATGSYNLATRLLELIFVSLGEELIWSLDFNDHTMQVVIEELNNVCGKATFTVEQVSLEFYLQSNKFELHLEYFKALGL